MKKQSDDKFKGRKGQKLLKELNERIEQSLQQTDEHAAKSQEMELILRSIPDPEARLYFVESYAILDRHWNGIKDTGFLRLCAAWIRRKKETDMDRQKIEDMFMDVLPSEDMQKVRGISSDWKGQDR